MNPFGFRRLTYIRAASESKKLNDLHGPFLVISASGMCEAGRILHHLRNNIEDPRNTVLITGFQAEHTLGRKILEKQAEVRTFTTDVLAQAGDAVFDNSPTIPELGITLDLSSEAVDPCIHTT